MIADNASTDATAETIVPPTPIACRSATLRHASNIGGYGNWQFVLAQAAGRYVVYVADDDSILGDQVASAVAKMEADPELGVVYAPWLLFDLVAQQSQGQFFNVPHDLRIERNEHVQLLDHVLRHHIFPEIQIIRRDVLQATMPRVNEHAFFAFVHAADYLTQGAILIQRQPFYVSITRYFEDDQREQLGNSEVEHAWDRYRGGLEYMIARTGVAIGAEERFGLHARIQQMIASRMAVAIRLRHLQQARPDRHLSPGDAAARPRLRVAAAGAAGDAGLRGDAGVRDARRRAAPRRSPDDLHRHERPRRARLLHARGARAGRVPARHGALRRTCRTPSSSSATTRSKAQELDSVAAAPRNVRIVRERDVAARFGLCRAGAALSRRDSRGPLGRQVRRRLAGDGALPHALVQRLDVARERGAVEERARRALGAQMLAQRRRGAADRRPARAPAPIGGDVAADQLVEADRVQQAGGDALGEGRALAR